MDHARDQHGRILACAVPEHRIRTYLQPLQKRIEGQTRSHDSFEGPFHLPELVLGCDTFGLCKGGTGENKIAWHIVSGVLGEHTVNQIKALADLWEVRTEIRQHID